MKRSCFLLLMLLSSSCQWIATHPKEDAEAILAIEELAKEAYEYESKTLSPAPPMNQDIWHKNGPVAPPYKPGVFNAP